MKTRRCNRCGQVWPLDDFHRDSTGTYCRKSTCRHCRKIQRRTNGGEKIEFTSQTGKAAATKRWTVVKCKVSAKQLVKCQ